MQEAQPSVTKQNATSQAAENVHFTLSGTSEDVTALSDGETNTPGFCQDEALKMEALRNEACQGECIVDLAGTEETLSQVPEGGDNAPGWMHDEVC